MIRKLKIALTLALLALASAPVISVSADAGPRDAFQANYDRHGFNGW